MSNLTRDALRAIQERIRDVTGKFAAGTITAVEFNAEVGLLSQALEVLGRVAKEGVRK